MCWLLRISPWWTDFSLKKGLVIQYSPFYSLQAQLIKLPRNLLAKTSTIRNTGHVIKTTSALIELWPSGLVTYGVGSFMDFWSGVRTDATSCFISRCAHGKLPAKVLIIFLSNLYYFSFFNLLMVITLHAIVPFFFTQHKKRRWGWVLQVWWGVGF